MSFETLIFHFDCSKLLLEGRQGILQKMILLRYSIYFLREFIILLIDIVQPIDEIELFTIVLLLLGVFRSRRRGFFLSSQ